MTSSGLGHPIAIALPWGLDKSCGRFDRFVPRNHGFGGFPGLVLKTRDESYQRTSGTIMKLASRRSEVVKASETAHKHPQLPPILDPIHTKSQEIPMAGGEGSSQGKGSKRKAEAMKQVVTTEETVSAGEMPSIGDPISD
nr:unnamed protein product [Digitaria exilis]